MPPKVRNGAKRRAALGGKAEAALKPKVYNPNGYGLDNERRNARDNN